MKFDGKCPICSSTMKVQKYHCPKCKIEISGDFENSNLSKLDSAQTKFVEIFLKNRGNVKKVEKELGISYPTVIKGLEEIISTLEKPSPNYEKNVNDTTETKHMKECNKDHCDHGETNKTNKSRLKIKIVNQSIHPHHEEGQHE